MKITIGQAISAAILAMNNAQQLITAVQAAQAEGRDELTKDEVDRFRAGDDASRQALQAEIDAQTAGKPPG